MTHARLACACLVAAGAGVGFCCGRLSSPERPTTQSSPPEPIPTQTSHTKFSVAWFVEARGAVNLQRNLGKEVLAWLQSLPRIRFQDPKELTYDPLAVYHAIEFLGDIRYAPAIPFLVREAFENVLCIHNPEVGPFVTADIPFEVENPIHGVLVRVGASSAPPLVDEYVRFWSLPEGQWREGCLWAIRYDLEHDALVAAALKHIDKRLVKANFAEVSRDELDALQHLKQELLKGID